MEKTTETVTSLCSIKQADWLECDKHKCAQRQTTKGRKIDEEVIHRARRKAAKRNAAWKVKRRKDD